MISSNENDKKNYYNYEINKIFPISIYGIKIKLKSSNGETKWLDLNKISLECINNILNI